jgi:hypothetical protein
MVAGSGIGIAGSAGGGAGIASGQVGSGVTGMKISRFGSPMAPMGITSE